MSKYVSYKGIVVQPSSNFYSEFDGVTLTQEERMKIITDYTIRIKATSFADLFTRTIEGEEFYWYVPKKSGYIGWGELE